MFFQFLADLFFTYSRIGDRVVRQNEASSQLLSPPFRLPIIFSLATLTWPDLSTKMVVVDFHIHLKLDLAIALVAFLDHGWHPGELLDMIAVKEAAAPV